MKEVPNYTDYSLTLLVSLIVGIEKKKLKKLRRKCFLLEINSYMNV